MFPQAGSTHDHALLSAGIPSLQLALLKPILEKAGIPAQTFSLFMHLADRIWTGPDGNVTVFFIARILDRLPFEYHQKSDKRPGTQGCREKSMKAAIFISAGWLLILAGLAGLVLPIIPGTILLVAGVMFLSRHHSWAHRLLAATRKKYPHAWRSLRDYRARLRRWWIHVRERFHPKKAGAGHTIR